MPEYLLAKFLHVLIAIVALGTSAGLGIVLEFYGGHPVHGAFVLRAIARIVAFFVLPGYALMLATGLWMVDLAWPMTAGWIRAALALWGVGVVALAISLAVLHKQIRLFDTERPASASYRRASLLGRALGAAAGLVVVVILALMVFKPGA
ncbi:MAG: DUF2269 family protein [Burkholderiales bacterium]